MILTRDYITSNLAEGVITADLSSWEEFSNIVTGRLFNTSNYIWRGQRSTEWLLESTLDRMLKKSDTMKESFMKLKSFMDDSSGRKRSNPEEMESDDDWWASGQHCGLTTPLLEWTISPFIAAYFAFCKEDNDQDKRAIYSLAQRAVIVKNNELKMKNPGTSEDDLFVKYIKPPFEDNPRLVNRSTLFTKSPTGVDIEQWVRKNFCDASKAKVILLKLTLPNTERTTSLKALDRMNINHLTLSRSNGRIKT